MISSQPRVGERFQLRRRIGSGGAGIVYDAWDHERGERVALKTLRDPNGDTLYRLKREFRALAELSHPNLVELHDLFVDDDSCFFTMEYVDGPDVVGYCDAGAASDPHRVHEVLVQITRALRAVHAAGKVHRDIKPSNVLVTGDRVVLLDFGLAADLAPELPSSLEGQVVGTVDYMAPEQAEGRPATPAADWYSLGVLLYRLLTGALPFDGAATRVLLDKRRLEAPRARNLAPDVPEPLDELCAALLERDPDRRADGAEILARLGAEDERSGPRTHTAAFGFTGRTRELAELEAALMELARGDAGVVTIEGPSGMGKTALAREFVDRARTLDADLVVLRGRCFQRERVPYRAVDEVLDQLSAYWRQLDAHEAAALLPDEAALLRRLFPVLGRVPAVAAAPRRDDGDPQELRNRAFAALRKLLQRLGDRRPVILWLDDMQWLDADSLTLLEDLMRPPDEPRLLLLLTARAGQGRDSPLERLLATTRPPRRLHLGPLPPEDAAALARALLGLPFEQRVGPLVRESGGNPFFLVELAHHLQTAPDEAPGPLRLDDILGRRIAALPAPARALLQAVAVAGEPVSRRVAARVIEVPLDRIDRIAGALRAAWLVQASGNRPVDTLQINHDRIRRVATTTLEVDEVRGLHRGLALALEEWNEGTPERLAFHWHGAGELERAADEALRAAAEAWDRLEFDRAAALYHLALQLGHFDDAERHRLQVALGEALANAGRPALAADAFEEASSGADRATALELRRRVAEQLLCGGYIERGLTAIRAVLADIGLRLPSTPRRALLGFVWRRLLVHLRGLRWRRRAESDIPQSALTRADVFWSVAIGLGVVDHVRGADFGARNLLTSMKLGEPTRLARALALEAAFMATQGHARRADRLLEEARALARDTGDPHSLAIAALGQGLFHVFLDSDWARAHDHLATARGLLIAQHRPTMWELDQTSLFTCVCLMWMGRIPEFEDHFARYVREARRKGDHYLEVCLRARYPIVWLLRDQPERAAANSRDAIAAWIPESEGYHVQHYYARIGRAEIALYTGLLEEARADLARTDAPLERSFTLRVGLARVEDLHLRARVYLASAARMDRGSSSRTQLLARVERIAASLDREPVPLARPLGLLVRAGLHAARDEKPEAAARLREAILTLDRMHMALYAAAARRRLGLLGEADSDLRELDEGGAWMRRRGIVDLDRTTAMLVP